MVGDVFALLIIDSLFNPFPPSEDIDFYWLSWNLCLRFFDYYQSPPFIHHSEFVLQSSGNAPARI